MVMSFQWESHGKRRLVHGNVIPMGIPWEPSHGMGQAQIAMGWEWDR